MLVFFVDSLGNEFEQQVSLIEVCHHFKVAESDEAGRHSADNSAGFHFRVPVVEHVPQDLAPGVDQTERAGGGDVQVVHGLGTQLFPNAGTHHRIAICAARVGGHS